MAMEKVFHMKGGLGETSYFNNCAMQKSVAERMKDITLKAIEEMYVTLRPKSLGIADLGCSSGSNAVLYIKRLVGSVEVVSRDIQQPLPEFRVCLNDFPSNDFNTLFQALPDLYQDLKKGRDNGRAPSVHIAAYPGNFYGRVFPDNSLHFVYSFSCLHWLSRVPPGIYDEQGVSLNKKSVYITKNSPPQVYEAYAKQFQEDFSLFLESRSQEIVAGGRTVLVFTGRDGDIFSRENTFFWEVLYQSFCTLVSKGKVEEEKLDSYEVHYYGPSREEIEHEVTKQGSFELERLEMIEKEVHVTSSGVAIAKTVRAVQESMISHHFGEAILDDLFDEYGRLLDREMAKEYIRVIDIALVLRKI